jgi:hypothetical protein
MSHARTRLASIAGSLALTAALVSAPAVLAQDGPEATVEGLLAAIEAKDFEALPSFFCAEFSDQVAAFDMSALTDGMPPGLDASALLDAFILDTEITSLEVLSQTDSEALVQLEGSLSMELNAEAMVPFIEALVEMSGMDVTPETVEMFSGLMLSEFQAEETAISEQITLVPGEAMPWVVCSELGAAGGGLDDGTADSSPAPVESIAPAVTEEEAVEGE